MNQANEGQDYLNGVAIIGMAGRFPMAESVDEYWQNLIESKECISFYTDEELIESGIDPKNVKNPDYIKAKGAVGNVDMFDAAFFGINPREAEVTDPQHRMLLECAWEALEHAGYDSNKFDGPIGVFAGKSMDYYLLTNVYPQIRKEISAGSLQAAIGNDKDSLTTLIAYRMNLTGPAITVQTSSSTSLVAVAVAAQSVLTYQCDIALAGGITAGPPIKSGYLYQAGGIWAKDGHCRAFDAKASGFVPGSGMGMVVLKRLEDAVADGDNIWAVITGYAVNNDGSNKVSYSAPSVDAQAEVVALAQAMADVHPETIQYIECHGTGTNLGDPIEVTALNQAFSVQTDKKHFCAIGSTKTNIGHLDNAAGVAGLIKTAMALKHKKIPATLHFETPNPKIDWENSPFFVSNQLTDWERGEHPRRAGVSSIGMGGTNAHVIVEEAPELDPSGDSRDWKLMFLSAKTGPALDARTRQLADFFKQNPETNLADAAYTLQVGRKDLNYRRFFVCQDMQDAAETLESWSIDRMADGVCDILERPVVFMFTGQGSQYVNMAKEIYQTEPVFKENLDNCARILKPMLGIDILEIMYPANPGDEEANAEKLRQTWLTQPVLFAVEYSLAQLWMDLGIEPKGMIGHSIGEFTAACVSGVMTLEDALTVVTKRGRLMQDQEEGSMLSIVGVKEADILDMLDDELSLGAINSPKHCVVSGRTEAIEELEKKLSEQDIFYKRLRTSHAFHSPMMESIVKDFEEVMKTVKLHAPEIPFVSGVTGKQITPEEAVDPLYWGRQLRQAVRFSDGVAELLKDSSPLLLEVGPGTSLCVLAQQHRENERDTEPPIVASIRQAKTNESDMAFLMKAIGQLWVAGVHIDWNNFYRDELRYRIPLPTYPFERKRYWIEAAKDIYTGAESDPEKPAESQTAETPGETPKTEEKTDDGKAFQDRPRLKNEYVAPKDDIQKGIVAIWEDILGIKPIGIDDNFFDLGGHSLLATLFLSRLQETYNVRLELRVIFESPTVATIAQMVKEQQGKSADLKDIESLVDEIEGLSDEELEDALSEEESK